MFSVEESFPAADTSQESGGNRSPLQGGPKHPPPPPLPRAMFLPNVLSKDTASKSIPQLSLLLSVFP